MISLSMCIYIYIYIYTAPRRQTVDVVAVEPRREDEVTPYRHLFC